MSAAAFAWSLASRISGKSAVSATWCCRYGRVLLLLLLLFGFFERLMIECCESSSGLDEGALMMNLVSLLGSRMPSQTEMNVQAMQQAGIQALGMNPAYASSLNSARYAMMAVSHF